MQLIELLSIRAPSPEKKLKLLKDIAVEHELDWDPSASETELLKNHEDLLVSIERALLFQRKVCPEHGFQGNMATYKQMWPCILTVKKKAITFNN